MEIALRQRYQEVLKDRERYQIESKWIAGKNNGVKFYAFVGSNGYAIASKGYISSLVHKGIYVLLQPIKFVLETGADILAEDDTLLAVCLHNTEINYDTVIIHSVPTSWDKIVDYERGRNPNVKIFGLTVWETDRVYPSWMDIIVNNRLTGLIVPSHWNAEIFKKTAKDNKIVGFPPVYVCHHLITDYLTKKDKHRTRSSRSSLYGKAGKAFLCIGSWTPRKGVSETVEAYLQAFKKSDDVVLYLKTFLHSYSLENSLILQKRLNEITSKYPNPAKIVLNTDLVSDDQIDDLISNCDVFVSLCNSEGVGLGACQSALNGKIVIMTGYGGQIEYIKQAHWIDYRLDVVDVPTGFVNWICPPQKWAYPSIDHSVKLMKNVYNNMERYKEEAHLNRRHLLKNFNHSSIYNQLQVAIKFDPKNCPIVKLSTPAAGPVSSSRSRAVPIPKIVDDRYRERKYGDSRVTENREQKSQDLVKKKRL